MVLALVTLAVVSALGMSAVRRLAESSRAAQQQAWQVQAAWLAESGLERAAARLANEPEYRGETWRPASPVAGQSMGLVQIEVINGSATGRWQVAVSAWYPDDPLHAAKLSKQLRVDHHELR